MEARKIRDTSYESCVEFSPTHRSRYKWGSRNATPPELAKVSRLLGKLARKHREFPGCAIPQQNLRDAIANELGEERGAADDYVRALKNLAILVSITLPDGHELLVYDQTQMDRAVAFAEGGAALTEPQPAKVQARVCALLDAAASQESSPASNTFALHENSAALLAIPDFEEVLLRLDDAKRNIEVADGAGSLEDVVVNPLSVLTPAYPRCDVERLKAHLSRAVANGYLTPLGKDVYRVTLNPPPASSPASPPGSQSESFSMERVLDEELVKLRIALRQAEDAMEREMSRLAQTKAAALSALQIEHERGIRGGCDEIRREAETALNRRKQEIDASCGEQLEVFLREYRTKADAVRDEASRVLEAAAHELSADAESQIARIQADGAVTWTAHEERCRLEQAELERVELLPFASKLEELRERISLIRQVQEKSKPST